jgi:DNA primase large subunit
MGSEDVKIQNERQKDHYSHYILRLAFSSTEDLRRRFSRLETALFKLRFKHDDARERQEFVESLDLAWEVVLDEEKRDLGKALLDATPSSKRQELGEGGWFKVDFETVPELVENRKVLIKAGKAYVPSSEQLSMVLASFSAKLDKGLEVLHPHQSQPSWLEKF